MKNILAALFVFVAANSFALEITTRKGVRYSDAKITAVEKEGVRIIHSNGTAAIDFDELPPALQAQYGWTPEKSAARKTARDAAAVAKQKADDEARIAAAQAQKSQQEADRAAAEHARIYAENAAAAARYKEDQKRQAAEAIEKAKKDGQEREQLISNVFMYALLMLGLIFAFLPTLIARGKPQAWPVFFLNLLSLFGGFGHATEDRIMAAAVYVVSSGIWITAFILALKPKPQLPHTINVMINQPPAPRQIQARPIPIAATPRAIAKAPAPPNAPPPPPPV